MRRQGKRDGGREDGGEGRNKGRERVRGERETHKLALSRSEPSIVPYDTSIARRRPAKRIIFHPYSFAHHPSISHPFAKHAPSPPQPS